ncbi:hypothetical protein BD410DRAFT_803963 [Rickenella mellea]|uniref:Glycosyltransferase 61 catalytic domain-containing protein n=1 Tax=Rickenella mellea TaxID=50990 RepID=A0A4Y7Q2J4_9AGAM|nr:hypothetical protein BD410DRAFT_803963 [Rickenella mellea]
MTASFVLESDESDHNAMLFTCRHNEDGMLHNLARQGQSVLTRRELLLIFGLLVVLIFVFQNGAVVFSPPSVTLDDVGETGMRNRFSGPHLRDPWLTWSDTPPETTLVAHAPGWTMFDRLYILNGTLYVVSFNRTSFPELRLMYSTGRNLKNGKEEASKRLPTDKEIRIISPVEARRLFGTSATRIDGPNWLVNDPKQFINHYYHWTAELLFGLWRAYSSLDPYITPDGATSLPPPRRLLFTHIGCMEWRDYASMNEWVLRGAFPSISMEFSNDWADRAKMARPFVFDRVLIADRLAALHGATFRRTERTASEALALPGSPHWWFSVRNNVLEFSGLAPEWVLEPDPGAIATRQKFVITYISRQGWSRRKLRESDHEELVRQLMHLKERYGYEVNVVEMEKLTRAEQLQLSGRTTIMMGVHGNGLTSLVWMRPTPLSTVIEFFYPQGWAFDYEYAARALGMVHYGVWNNITFTRPNVPERHNYVDGFQGNEIPIDGLMVADLNNVEVTNGARGVIVALGVNVRVWLRALWKLVRLENGRYIIQAAAQSDIYACLTPNCAIGSVIVTGSTANDWVVKETRVKEEFAISHVQHQLYWGFDADALGTTWLEALPRPVQLRIQRNKKINNLRLSDDGTDIVIQVPRFLGPTLNVQSDFSLRNDEFTDGGAREFLAVLKLLPHQSNSHLAKFEEVSVNDLIHDNGSY